MTPYSRGYAAALKAAADVCRKTGDTFGKGDHQTGAYVCQQKISRLPILGEATNPGEQVAENHKGAPDVRASARPGPCVVVPVEELKIVLDFFRKANWPDTRAGNAAYRLNNAMLAAAKEE